MNRNYQKELDKIIQKRGKKLPRVLLHSCCGPCSSSVLEYLTQYFDVTLLWYNPNIYPQQEFDRRFKTQVKLIEDMGLADKVSVLAEPRKSEDYYARIKGLENEPEGGKRCTECFRVRLLEAGRLAIELCEKYNVYRKLYCGCEFSLRHREEAAREMAESREEKTNENE